MAPDKSIFIIAGPNGAGKTTFAKDFLPDVLTEVIFVNADEIARAIQPDNVAAVAMDAGRATLERIGRLVDEGSSFAFETTLAGRSYSKHIPFWKRDGYNVFLYFLSLPSAEAAINRVAIRVSQGGHNIPELVIRRRFTAGLQNFHQLYKPLVTGWVLYDNSGNIPIVLEQG
ncbi:zeta toxin family protein [Ferrovibrio sp.]|uniref:zeta toxin family protein n=1 Tax=Ferrovibrio sp. TaxID=1917215 RepID=UPI001B498500|nr:zeta toxin family protein [Ferrovibrio sp.]MBP7063345.1 zeta toxin family protein [Ferrovibrio sp.]